MGGYTQFTFCTNDSVEESRADLPPFSSASISARSLS
jgi:hypothetical protein